MKRLDALDDLSTLTTIPYINLQKLFYRLNTIIAYEVQETAKNKEQVVSIDIGIGTLNILITEDAVSYKFIPSPSLEQNIVDGINSSDIVLVRDVEDLLRNRIMNTYKDLL